MTYVFSASFTAGLIRTSQMDHVSEDEGSHEDSSRPSEGAVGRDCRNRDATAALHRLYVQRVNERWIAVGSSLYRA